MFIDISNVFDRIWDDGLFLLKLKQSCVIGNLFQLVTSFLGGIFQRVLRNGQMSYWELIRAGLRVQIVQDSTLGLLVFLAEINNLTGNLKSNVKLFTDNSSLCSKISEPLETANILNNDLRKNRK